MIGAFLEATVREVLRRRGDSGSRLAIAIHSPTPPDREQVRDMRVVWCRSTLEMRDHLAGSDPANLVIVTPVEEELAADIKARIYRQKLFPIDVREMLKQLYEARDVDSRVAADQALSTALLRCTPVPVAGGILHEEAAWQTVCPEIFQLTTARPDAEALLQWVAGPAAERLAAAPADLRDRLVQWLTRTTGPIAGLLLAVAGVGQARSAIAIGIALRAILADQGKPELAQALVRLERFTGNQPIPREVAQAWAAAAEKLLPAGDVADIVASADRLLNELGASAFAWLSRWSLLGNEQLIDRFAADLAELPANPDRLESALASLRDRYWPKAERPLLGRLEMGVRLLRWLHLSDPAHAEFEDLARWYAAEGSWVDWARTRIRGGYERGALASALARLTSAVKERRERLNLQFAQTLAVWNNQGAHFRGLRGVESVLEGYIPPEQPVLVIVLDGMSFAVCRELSADPTMRRWTPWSPDGREIPPAVTALPSVTEFSRFSLISGNLARGTQGAEEAAFASRSLGSRQHPPVLFHKNDLAAMSDPDSPVLREIANTRRTVVGIVVNAIDDSLSGPVQIAPDWNLEYLAVLRPVLAEASAAGRVVLLTSDHGHVLDYGSEFRRQDGSDRYRTGRAEIPGEFELEGGRVIGSAITALGREGVRYSAKPRNGYHGGITPEECLVPVVVLADRENAIRGWQEVAESAPDWWLAGASAPAAVPSAVDAAKPKRKTKQVSLFAEEPDWVAALLANDVFLQQMDLPGNRIKADVIAGALRALDAAGGRLLRPVFASRMNLALVRVSTTVAMMQRVLNYDGYGVLTIDESADMVVLNRSLLEVQFKL
jgi:hypothetical protein